MKTNEFFQGMGVVLGCLIRNHGQPSMAVDIMRSNGLSRSDFENAGLEEFDLNPIRQAWMDNPECGYCGDTGEVACSSTSYMACPRCSKAPSPAHT